MTGALHSDQVRHAQSHQSVCPGALSDMLGRMSRCCHGVVRSVGDQSRPDCSIVARVIRWRSAAGRDAVRVGRLGRPSVER